MFGVNVDILLTFLCDYFVLFCLPIFVVVGFFVFLFFFLS